MREGVPERFQISSVLANQPESGEYGGSFPFRRHQQSAPQAAWRAAFEQQAGAVADEDKAGAALGQFRSQARCRQRRLAAAQARLTVRAHRANPAARPAAGAQGGAEIHQTLRVAFDIRRGEQAFGQRPQFAVYR